MKKPGWIRAAAIGAAVAVMAGAAPISVLAQDEATELTIWSHWVEPDKKAWIEEVIADYTAENPNVTINIEWYGDKADLYTQLNAANQAGGENAPDIHTLDFRPLGHIPQQLNGWLLNLDQGLDTSHWDEGLLGAGTYDGGIWGLPIEAFGIWVWYDKTVFDDWGIQIPEDGRVDQALFDQIVAKAKENDMLVFGQGVQNLTNFAAHYPIGVALNMAGKDEVAAAVISGEKPYNDPAFVEALQVAVDQIHTDGFFNKDVPTLTLNEGAGLFFNRKAAMTAEGSWLPGWYKGQADDGAAPADVDLQIMRFPIFDGAVDDGVVQWGAGSGWGASAFTKHPDTVIDFFNFMSTPERAFKWIEMTDVPTGMVTEIPESASDLVRTQLAWQKDGPAISPAIYQVPAGDEEVAWNEGMVRFFADPNYTAQEFLDMMQSIREG